MRSRDTCAREPRASASDHSSEGGNAPSRSRLVSYPNAFAGYVRLRAARVSKRSLIRGWRRSLTVAARKLPKYVRAIPALASRARQQAITNQNGGDYPSRSRLVGYPNAFARYVRLRAARVSKRSLFRGGDAPSRSRLVSYPNTFARYLRLRAARVSKRSLIRRRRRSLTVAARKLPKCVRAIRALASRARQQAITIQRRRRSLTVAARKLPKYVRAIRALASRARQQAITNQRAATLPHGRGS